MAERSMRLAVVANCLLLPWSALAVADTPQEIAAAIQAPLPRLDIQMKRTTLANGLRVVMVEDHTAPVITVGLAYDVGAANEERGRTGFAHLFEHLMFQGSGNVAPGQHINVIEEYGGVANATTSTDWTFYFETVPANQLDLALFLESDRLISLKISAENLAREIEVVKEERRMRFDNQAYRNSLFVLQGLMYDSFAYAHDGVGSMADLGAASLADVRGFFDAYYRASNVVLVLIGDFTTAQAVGKVEQYFAKVPTRPKPPPADRTESTQQQDRRSIVEDPHAPLPQLSIAYKSVPGDHPDYFALSVLSAVLQEGHSSRLHERLVKERELTTALAGSVDERRGVGAFYVTAAVRSEQNIGAVESEIYEQIERLQREPIADWELAMAKNSIATRYLDRMSSSVMRAIFIGVYAVDFNDPGRINSYLDRIAAVTKEDVRRVAAAHLRSGNRTVLVTMPKKQEGAK
jgi:zinc protease